MATAGKPIDECSKCHEMQKSYLKTLDEKRTLLVRIQGEQEKSRKLRRDVEKLKGKMSGKRKATSVPQDLTETEVRLQIMQAVELNFFLLIVNANIHLQFEDTVFVGTLQSHLHSPPLKTREEKEGFFFLRRGEGGSVSRDLSLRVGY